MKWSPLLHTIAALAGVFGVIAIFAGWILGFRGTLFGLSQAHLFNNGMMLLLISIAFGIGTLIHQREEQQ